jgi:hypothetical protein
VVFNSFTYVRSVLESLRDIDHMLVVCSINGNIAIIEY